MRPGRPERPECIDAATLAAFVDGTLDASSREAVERHLADCAECREAWAETVAVIAERGVSGTTSNLAGEMRRRSRGWIYAGAAAAIVVLAAGTAWLVQRFSGPDRQAEGVVAELASSASSWRPITARLSGPFDWSPAPSPTRGTAGLTEAPLGVQSAAIRARQLASEQPTARTLWAEGLALLMLRDFDGAVRSLDEASRLEPDAADVLLDMSASLLARGQASEASFDITRALDAAERAATLAPSDPRAYFNQALALEALGLLGRAKSVWEKYLSLDATGPWSTEARERLKVLEGKLVPREAAGDLGGLSPQELFALASSSPVRVMDALEEVIVAWPLNGAPEPSTAARVRTLAGALRHARADLVLPDLADAILQAPTGDARRRGCLLTGLRAWQRARDASRRKAWDQALAAAHEAEPQFACGGGPRLAAVFEGLWAQFMAGRYEEAIRTARPLIVLAESSSYWRVAAGLHYMSALWALSQPDLSAGQADLTSAQRLAEQAGDLPLQAAARAALAEAFDEQGDRSTAWSHLSQGLRALGGDERTDGYADLVVTAAIAAAHGGLPGAALHFSEEAIRVAGRESDASRVLLGSLQRARALVSLNRHGDAVGDLESARRAVAGMSGERQRAWQAELGWIEGLIYQRSNSTRAIRGLTSAIDYFESVQRPFRLAELLLARGVAHAEAGDPAQAAADWQRGADVLEDQRPAMRDEQLRISRSAEVWELFGKLADLRAGDPIAALGVIERARSRELLAHLAPTQELQAWAVPVLQQALPEGALAIAYAVRPDRLFIWTISRTEVRLHVESMTSMTLARHVSDSRTELMGPGTGPATRLLGRLLIPSSLPIDPEVTLVLVPDGVLHQVAFAALEIPGRPGRLVEHARPVIAPSLTMFAVASARARAFKPTSALVAGVGAAVPEADLPVLPGVPREIARVQALYRSSEMLTGADATAGAILRRLGEHPVIHLSGHARVDAAMPSRSRFYTSPAGASNSITLGDIAGRRVQHGAVVVLGACDTVVGRTFAGDSPISLGRSFLAAGASAVIGALWPIADDQALGLLELLHTRIVEGDWASTALARAQRDALRAGVPVAGWAAFVMTGGERPPAED